MNKKADNFISIGALLRLCAAKWHWYALALFISLLWAAYYLISKPNQYTCKATIMVRDESKGYSASNVGGDEFNKMGLVQENIRVSNVASQLNSLDVLMEVVESLKITNKESSLLSHAEDIKSRLDIESTDKSNIIHLTYRDYTPEKAKRILSLILKVYDNKWLKDKQLMTEKTSIFIDSRLRLLERDLDRVDDSISSFKSRYQITDLERVSDIYLQQQSQSNAEILKLTNQLAMAEYIREFLDEEAPKHQLLPVNTGISNVTESQISHYNELVMQYNSHLEYTSDQNPLIINLEKELSVLRSNILSSVDNQINTLVIQLRSMEGYSGEATSKITSNPAQAKYLVSIEREQKVKESLYLYLLQKKEEIEITGNYVYTNTQIINSPHGSSSPTSPKPSKILFAAIMLALLLPTIILFIKITFDETVRDRADIERATSLPLIGTLPFYGKRRILTIPLRFLKRKPSSSTIVVAEDKQDAVNEAFRILRYRLENMYGDNGSKVFMVTSFDIGEGKTFISTNLALTLAIQEKRVLFIDADLRHGSASRIWKAPKTGLTDFLKRKEGNASTLTYPHPHYPTLDILPVGSLPSNPTELLATPSFAQLIETMRPNYDIILIDTPQADSIADASIIGSHVDATLFVVRTGRIMRSRLDELDALNQSKEYKQIAVILNATNNT